MDTSIQQLKYSQGFTLTEIMVALVISSILMAGVLTIMASSKRTYALQSELSELQENARFAIDELAREIRMAGYRGCRSDLTKVKDASNNGQEIDWGAANFAMTLNGESVNNRSLPDAEGTPVSEPFPATDALVISSFSEQLQVNQVGPTDLPADLNEEFDYLDKIITLQPRSIVPAVDENLVVSNCGGATINYRVTASDVLNSKITITPALIKNYKQPVEVFRSGSPVAYEVRRTDEGKLILFKCEDRDRDDTFCEANEQEHLIEGVENMQIRYGIDIAPRDGKPNRYSSTPNLGTDEKVVSVRITLLMRTNNQRGDLEGATDRAFQLDPALTYNPQQNNAALEKGYRHRMFTSTIKVRN